MRGVGGKSRLELFRKSIRFGGATRPLYSVNRFCIRILVLWRLVAYSIQQQEASLVINLRADTFPHPSDGR